MSSKITNAGLHLDIFGRNRMEFIISRLKLTLTIIFGLSIVFGASVPTKAQKQIKDPLTLEMITTGLNPTSLKASSAELNEYIKLRVNELGVDFPLTAKIEKDLRTTGASDSLIEVIRRKAPKVVNEKERAEAKIRREKREKEIADLTKAIEKNPKDADAYKKRADLYEIQADFELALEDYVRALEIKPDDQTTKYSLNSVLDEIGDYLVTPIRQNSDPVFKRDAIVKGYISRWENRRREMILNPPFYKGNGDKSFGDKKDEVKILAFVNDKGRVVSATAISNQFWLTDSAIRAAKSSSFFEKKSTSEKSANDWFIIIYEYER